MNTKSLLVPLTITTICLFASSCTIRVNDHGNGISSKGRTLTMGNGHKGTIECSGEMETRTFDLKDFSTIEASGSYDIIYEQDEGIEASATVTSDDNLFDFLVIKSEKGKLILSLEDGYSYRNVKQIEVRLKSSTLEDVTVAGAAKLSCRTGLKSDKLGIDLSGAGEILMDGMNIVKDMNIKMSGAGKAKLRGITAENLIFNVSGAGSIEASGIDTRSVNIDISGAGNAKLEGKTGSARYSLSGVGNINATGLTADEAFSDKSGIGRIRF